MTTNNPDPGNATGLTFAPGQHPHDKLMNAISILQMVALAEDSQTDGKSMWGNHYMPGASLDHAIKLMIDVLEYVEVPWVAKSKGAKQ